MALVSLNSEILWPFSAASLTRYAITLDANSEGLQWCGVDIPLTGTLTHVVFATANHTSTATADVSIEGVGTNGMGSGSLYVANANGTISVNAANSVFECAINGGTGVSVTHGDPVCVKVAQPSSGAGNFQVVAGATGTGLFAPARSFIAVNTSGSWAKDGTYPMPMVGFKYSGGVYVPIGHGHAPATALGGDGGFNSGSSPDERGNRIVVPFACRASGIWAYQWNFNNNDQRANLRNSSDTVIAQGATVDGDNYAGSGIRRYRFATPVALAANDVVHATLEAMTGSDINELQRLTTSSNAILALNPGGSSSYKVVYTNGASRTYTDTQVLSIGLLIDQLDNGAGSGGTTLVFNSRATSHLRR